MWRVTIARRARDASSRRSGERDAIATMRVAVARADATRARARAAASPRRTTSTGVGSRFERARATTTRAIDDARARGKGGDVDADARADEARARARARLREACAGTYRGALATRDDAAEIMAAAGALERLTTSETIEWDALDGKWRLAYTNAADVLGLLMASQRLGVPEVGDIFQSFGCANGTNTGITNEIRLSVPFLLSEAKVGAPGGVGLRVQASFKDVGRRRIALTFQEAQVSEISISPFAETLLAPAILPRSSLNHQVLMFIKELELKFPLRGALTSMGGGEAGAAVGTYHLTFCDEDMLIGRAAAGGIYIFTRA